MQSVPVSLASSAVRRAAFGVLLACLAAGTLVACEKAEEEGRKVPDAGKANEPALDPNLAKVLPVAKGASSASAPSPKRGAKGPPETGIFARGAADEEAKPGSAPTVKLGSNGSPPRVRIVARPVPGTRRKATLRLALRTGPRTALPTIDVALAFASPKGKAGADAGRAAVPVGVKVVQAKLAPTQPGAIPDQLKTQIAKLKGSKLTYQVAPNGGGYHFSYELSKTADPGLDQAMRSMSESISTLTVPVPDEPVGKDGFWMATSRESHSGADVVAYRLVKVTEVEEGRVTLSVSTKRYAASSAIDLSTIAPGQALEVTDFKVVGEGTVELAADEPFPARAELVDKLSIGLRPAGQPAGARQQRMGLNAQAQSLFTLAPSSP